MHALNGRTITSKKGELLSISRTNQEGHRTIVARASGGYGQGPEGDRRGVQFSRSPYTPGAFFSQGCAADLARQCLLSHSFVQC